MRNAYLIAYDVCDKKRLRKAYRLMCGAGDPLQYSVFRCELSPMEKQSLQESLWEILNFAEDRVLVVNLGPLDGRRDNRIECWGEPLTKELSRGAVVI
ncbi:MAG: CRISPR-associated endonuclease Cas2 [Planctomycetaceae bacterium]|nr:CRISPR-associated endonuclease Cas2 [Planctomycetaceae bacterium]